MIVLDLMPLFLGVALAQLAPGPNLLAVSAAALNHGRGAGLQVAVGVAAGVFLWAVFFAFGAGALLATVPSLLVAMKLVGGGYLIWLAARSVRHALRPPDMAPVAGVAAGPRRRFVLTGFGVVMTNPKAALMWVAVSLYLAGLGLTGAEVLPVGLGVAGSALAIYGGYAVLFSTGGARRLHRGLYRPVEAAFGALFGLIGARLILDGLRALR